MAPFPRCEAVILMSAQEYLVERDNAAFRGLVAEVMQLGEIDVVETWREDDIRYEKEVQKPDYDRWVPKVGRKLIKDRNDLDFYDVIAYDPRELESPPYRLPVSSSFPLLGDKLQVHRTIIIEPIDEGHCRHVVEGEVHTARLFGIGKLAEHMVIDSTVKTVEQLPEITARYLQVREEMMRTPEGRKALLEGVPDVVVEVAELDQILSSLALGLLMWQLSPCVNVVELGAEKVRESPVATEAVEEVRVAPGRERDWAAVIEAEDNAAGNTAANRATVAALREDRKAALHHLRRLSPSKIEKVLLKNVKHDPTLTRHERKAIKHLLEDEKHRLRRNEETSKWRDFWRRRKPATAPVGNDAARIVQLVSVGGAVGLVEWDEKGEVKAVLAEAEPADTAAGTAEDRSTKITEHKDRLGGLKKVFEKMRITKRHEE